MKKTIEQELSENGIYITSANGFSMSPMLKPDRNLVKLINRQARLKKYDVALFRRNNDYVLHRVIRVNDDSYDFLGDACVEIERNIRDDQIIGVLSEFVHNTDNLKWIKTDNIFYIIYSRLVVLLTPVRMPILKICYKIKK